MTTEQAKTIAAEIGRTRVYEGDTIMYRAGEWTIGEDGCQEGNTACLLVATGAGDGCAVNELDQWHPAEAVESIEAWHAHYDA